MEVIINTDVGYLSVIFRFDYHQFPQTSLFNISQFEYLVSNASLSRPPCPPGNDGIMGLVTRHTCHNLHV